MIAKTNFDLPQCVAGPGDLRATAVAPYGDLLAAISHEIRTPLTAVIGFCELMAIEVFGPVGDPRYSAYVRHIADGGAALLKSAEDTLLLSAIIADKDRACAPRSVELSQLLSDLLATTAATAAARCINLTIEAEGGCLAWADFRTLRQALLNLLIEAVNTAAPGSTIFVTVTREGASIDVRIAAQLAEDAPTPLQSFGLSIARTLVGLMGGHLETQSLDHRWSAQARLPSAAQQDLFDHTS